MHMDHQWQILLNLLGQKLYESDNEMTGTKAAMQALKKGLVLTTTSKKSYFIEQLIGGK